jgi:hypothetical protein
MSSAFVPINKLHESYSNLKNADDYSSEQSHNKEYDFGCLEIPVKLLGL